MCDDVLPLPFQKTLPCFDTGYSVFIHLKEKKILPSFEPLLFHVCVCVCTNVCLHHICQLFLNVHFVISSNTVKQEQ